MPGAIPEPVVQAEPQALFYPVHPEPEVLEYAMMPGDANMAMMPASYEYIVDPTTGVPYMLVPPDMVDCSFVVDYGYFPVDDYVPALPSAAIAPPPVKRMYSAPTAMVHAGQNVGAHMPAVPTYSPTTTTVVRRSEELRQVHNVMPEQHVMLQQFHDVADATQVTKLAVLNNTQEIRALNSTMQQILLKLNQLEQKQAEPRPQVANSDMKAVTAMLKEVLETTVRTPQVTTVAMPTPAPVAPAGAKSSSETVKVLERLTELVQGLAKPAATNQLQSVTVAPKATTAHATPVVPQIHRTSAPVTHVQAHPFTRSSVAVSPASPRLLLR